MGREREWPVKVVASKWTLGPPTFPGCQKVGGLFRYEALCVPNPVLDFSLPHARPVPVRSWSCTTSAPCPAPRRSVNCRWQTKVYENTELDTRVHGGNAVQYGLVQGTLRLRLLERLADRRERRRRRSRRRWGSSDGSRKLSDLPSKKVLTGYIKQAMKLNEDGVKSPTRSKPKGDPGNSSSPTTWRAPSRPTARPLATFEKFNPSHKREYVDWINEAKTQATRTRRLEQAIEWMAEGKPRNWKYMNC